MEEGREKKRKRRGKEKKERKIRWRVRIRLTQVPCLKERPRDRNDSPRSV